MSHSSRQAQLSVNVDHVATLRQARGTTYPDPLEAALLAEQAGATGITVHLREDRRHIQDHDVERIAGAIAGKLNLEMAAREEMLVIAERLGPQQVTLVPERPHEVTTEGGLDLLGRGSQLAEAIARLAEAGIAVSLFLDPEPARIEAAASLETGHIVGYEINTDAYTRAGASSLDAELAKVRAAAELGPQLGLAVYAGHGLTSANVSAISALPEIEELNIGHWLICRSVVLGLGGAVREMLAAMHR